MFTAKFKATNRIGSSGKLGRASGTAEGYGSARHWFR